MRLGGAETIGPILMGMSKPVYALSRGADLEDIVNMATIAVVEAQGAHDAPQVQEGERMPAPVASD